MSLQLNQLSGEIIGAAIEVHKSLGPGLLESAYRRCLCQELYLRGHKINYERPLSLEYKGLRIKCAYKYDILVNGQIIIECKSVEKLAPIHGAQLLTYLRVGGWPLGLLINFNVEVLKNGIVRRINGFTA